MSEEENENPTTLFDRTFRASEINRRNLMIATGVGMTSIGGFTQASAAQNASENEHIDVDQNTSSGEEIWSFETDDLVLSSPTVVNGTVFVGSNDNHVYALNAGDGTEVWSFETESEVGRVVSSPAVVDGTVFVGGGQAVYALDAQNGNEIWSFVTAVPRVRSSPTVVDGTVYVGGDGGTIYALDADDGSEIWSFETGGWVRSSPTVVSGTVFVGSWDANLYAVDAETGQEEWAFETGDRVRSSPTVVDGTVFVGSYDNNMYALDAADGSEIWSVETGNNVRSSPTVVDGTVFVQSDDHNVYALDAADGNEIWSVETGSGLSSGLSSPTVVDEMVFVGSTGVSSGLYARDATDGSEIWSFETGGSGFSPSPIVVDGIVFVANNDSNVYALDAGVEGSSEGSRVNLGTLGHHHEWAGEDSGEIPDDSDEEDQPDESDGNLDPTISRSTGVTTPGETISFDASGSTGNIATYEWELGDGTTDTGVSVSHSYDDPDTYAVTLTTISETGATATTSTEITIAEAGELVFSISPDSPVVEQSVTFEATGGDEYDWDFGDGTTASGQQVTHTYDTVDTYSVTVSTSDESFARDIEVDTTPITITDIQREFGGVPLESVSYEDTFQASVESNNQIQEVVFELGNQTQTATESGETYEASFDLNTLDDSDVLTATATDTEGHTVTAQQSVSITAVPDWMEWLIELADISVSEPNTQIDVAYDPFNLDSYTFNLGGIPIDVHPPEFDGVPQAKVGYNAGQQAAILDADGGIDAELFGHGFEAEMEIEGQIDSSLDLIKASGTAFGSVATQIGPPLAVDLPNGVPCLGDQIGIETTVSPGVELDADFDDEFEFQQGTATPETELVVNSQLNGCGSGAGSEVIGKLDASFDIGTEDPNLSGTVSGSGEVWVDVSALEAAIDVGFNVTLPASETEALVAQSQSPDDIDWTVTDKYGEQPSVNLSSVDDPMSTTASQPSLAPTSSNTTTESNSYERLTDRSAEDTQPAIGSGAEGKLVAWSSQREDATASAGRDIAYRRATETGWSEISYLTTDETSHDAPTVAVSNGNVLVVWEDVTTEIDSETEPADIHPHVEITYAIHDGETWSDPTRLTDSSNREFQPTVAETDAGWLVAWEQSTNSQASTDQRAVRYTQIDHDGTTHEISDISDAAYPDTGTHTDSGAVLGYASLDGANPTETVSTRIVDGEQTDSQRFDASAVRAVTVGEDRLIWQEGTVSDPTFTEGNRVTGTTNELTVRDEVVATAEPTLTTNGDNAVLSYRAYVDDGETRELVYRLNRGSGWIFDRQFVQAPEPDQTVWQPQSTFGSDLDSFSTVFAISERHQESKNDIFLTEHDFLPEYAISADGPSGQTDGDTVTLEYTLQNRGDIDGTQSVTVTVTNAAGTQATEPVDPLPAGEKVSDTVDVTVDETGEFDLSIETTETTLSIAVATSDGFETDATTVRVATPDIAVEEIEAVGADRVDITVSNSGGATAFDLPLRVTDGETALAETTIAELEYNDTTTTEVTISPDDIDRSSEDTVVVDPDETLPGAVREANRTTPTWLLQPNLGVSEQIRYRSTVNGESVADVVVSNASPVSGSGTLKAVNTDGSVVGSTALTISGSTEGTQYETVSVPLEATVSEEDELRFEIDPAVPDADPTTVSRKDTVGSIFADEQPEDGASGVDEYKDDGTVQTDGLREAIDDWRENDIDTDLLRDVIDAWRSR